MYNFSLGLFVATVPSTTKAPPTTTTEQNSEQELINSRNNLNNYGQSSTVSVLSEKGEFSI